MSLSEKRRVKCPTCGEEFEVEVYNSVNATLQPELEEAILNGTFFERECPICKARLHIDFPFLYHDMNHHFLIQYVEIGKEEEYLNTYKSSISKSNEIIPNFEKDYIFRVVSSYPLLVEKILALKAGLDDRLLEIAKIIVGSYYTMQNMLGEDDRVFLYKNEDGFKVDIANIQTGEYRSTQLNYDIYSAVKEDFEAYLNDEETKIAIIDETWAAKIINAVTNENQNKEA